MCPEEKQVKETPVQLTHLRALVVAADTGSLTDAADLLGYTEPAIHLQLAALSRAAGGPVLVRNRRNMELTSLGRALLPYAEKALRAVDGLTDEAARWHAQRQHVIRVGLGRTVGSYVFPHLASRVRETCPDIILETSIMSLADTAAAVCAGHVDIGIASGLRPLVSELPSTGKIVTVPLTRYSWVFAASPRLASRLAQGTNDAIPVYLPEMGGSLQGQVQELLASRGNFTVSLAQNTEAAKASALAEWSIACIQEYACRIELASGALVRCLVDAQLPDFVIHLAHQRPSAHPDLPLLVSCLRTFRGFLSRSPVVLANSGNVLWAGQEAQDDRTLRSKRPV
jgi:LysR family transcriptional regulator, low CO2-responsive transcriptional regulator